MSILSGKIEFCELNNGFEVISSGKSRKPAGMIYKENRPIADICRMMLHISKDDGFFEPIVKMSDKKRKIADLYFIEGFKMEDISKNENISIGTVKASIKQIKDKAVKLIKGQVKTTEKKRYIEHLENRKNIDALKRAKNKIKMIKEKQKDVFPEFITE